MKLYEPAPPARKDELANVQDGIAVIVDGDTCPVVVESGMYAYIKNNTHGLAEGLYKNISDSAFPTSGGTADGTVFEADSTGGLNALNASFLQQYDQLLYTTDTQGINQTLAHSLADYKYIIVAVTYNDGSELLEPIFVPVPLFRTKQRIRTGYYAGSGTPAGPVVLYYVNDTTVQFYCGSSSGHGILYGVK